jgi:hypothetical protein
MHPRIQLFILNVIYAITAYAAPTGPSKSLHENRNDESFSQPLPKTGITTTETDREAVDAINSTPANEVAKVEQNEQEHLMEMRKIMEVDNELRELQRKISETDLLTEARREQGFGKQ